MTFCDNLKKSNNIKEKTMSNLLDTLDSVLLMGPGPLSVNPRVYKAMGKTALGHMDAQFITLMDGIKENLKKVMNTKNEATIILSATGSSGMEAVMTNLVEEGDAMLVLVNGFFSERMIDVASRLGAQVDTLEFPWGKHIDTAEVAKKLKEKPYKLVAMVHGETSTGVLNPIKEIGPMVREAGAYFIVDAVTTLGGVEIRVDDWKIDALYSCSQKCMGCPSGLAPITFSDRAMEKITARKKKVPNFYLDMTLLMKYWSGSPRAYHHTAPSNMFFGFYEALNLILEEGLEKAWARHTEVHEYLVAGIEKMGLSMLVEKPWRMASLNTVLVPEGVDELAIRKELRQTHKIEIGAGLGSLGGKIWRIGIMGHTARKENVDSLLSALKQVVSR